MKIFCSDSDWAAFTGPLAGVEAVQVGVMESEVVLVDTAGHHPHVWELH